MIYKIIQSVKAKPILLLFGVLDLTLKLSMDEKILGHFDYCEFTSLGSNHVFYQQNLPARVIDPSCHQTYIMPALL